MEDGIEAQRDFWELLGTTQAVVDATGNKLIRPGKAVSCGAKSPARDEAQSKGRPTFAKAGAAANKWMLAPARYGNRTIVRRRKD